MSAPEDTTATAQLASDNHHQQNVVSPSAASTSSTSSSIPAAVVVAAGAAVTAALSSPPTPTNAGSPTVTTLSAAITGSAPDSVTGSGSGVVGASAILPANNGSNNSHSKEGVGAASSNSTAPDSNNGSVPSDVPTDATTDAANSCDSDKAAAAATGLQQPVATTSSPSRPDEEISSGVGGSSADILASIDPGSSGGTSTPIAGASPASATAGEIGLTNPLCGDSSLSSVVPAVTNGGGGGASNSSVPVSAGTTISVRGRGDITDKNSLEYHCRVLEDELQSMKDSEAKIKQQYSESQRRERILARRVAVQEQEMQDYAKQIAELKSAQAPGPAALRSALLDPAVNILFQKLKAELQATKAKLEETQNELSAWKFTPDSNTGKRLMAKCRLLYQENEELGKMTSNGRLAKLESELALQKSYNEEVKKSQLELDDFLQELDEDVEGMQGTIVFLQQELKQTKDSRDEMEKELVQLRAYVAANLGPFSGSANNPTSGSTPTDERSSSMMLMMEGQDSNSNNSHGHDAYHHPDGGGPDTIGGGGIGVGDMGGGVTPIYLVNGGGGGGGSGGSGNTDAGSRLVNKSSSSGDDHEMMVYSNRTHCGGVVTNSKELRTTPTIADSTNTTSSVAAAVNGGGGGGSGSSAGIAGVTSSSGGEPLVNELKDPLLPSVASSSSDGTGRSSSGNKDSNSGGCVADVDNSVNSTNSTNIGAALKQHPAQQRPSHSVGRNGGRTTVAARKRNYDETEVDSAGLLQAEGSSDVVNSGVLVMDVGVVGGATESSASSAGSLANGKLTMNVADGSHLSIEQQHPDVEPNSNKRMTRSGKGKAMTIAPATASVLSSSTSSSSSSSSSVSAPNVLLTSAAKKLRRGSIAPDDEVDPLSDEPPAPQQQQQPQQQTISSANGSN
ncbi:mucin-19 [Anopheles maculipalpis]|uniref:mucin-19 n=1 Tax=Anopheles maculipalpis TaxID=1496333 RepID=UPI0021598A7E|nr:mucin-19 [Anopheles maculipalpis]